MARLIAFDQKTAAGLRQQMPQHQIFEHGASDVADYLVGGPERLVAILPVDAPGEAGIAAFRRPTVEKPATPLQESSPVVPHPETTGALVQPAIPELNSSPENHLAISGFAPAAFDESALVRTRAGGFLGLRDEAVFEDEQKPSQKRNWWNRFWEEE
jgi:hypothetical protein